MRATILIGLFVWLVSAPAAKAQESGTIQAIATVATNLSMIPTDNLNFGTITPVMDKSVDQTDVGLAGEWSIMSTAPAEISIDVTLPACLYMAESNAPLRAWFWTGGTVRPTISQTGDDYSRDIVLTVTYTGN